MKNTIGIIGGGVAGIAAAIAANDLNADVHLFEALPQLGGRAMGGKGFDTGRHLVTTAYKNFLRLTNSLGSTRTLALSEQGYGYLDGRTVTNWQMSSANPLKPVTSLFSSRFLPRDELLVSAKALSRALFYNSKNEADTNDDRFIQNDTMNGMELFRNTNWPQTLRHRLGLPVLMGMFNASPNLAPASTFVNALRKVLLDSRKQIGWVLPPDYGSLISGPAAEILPARGVKVHTSSRVEELSQKNNAWIIKTKSDEIQVSSVIVTVPPWNLDFVAETGMTSELLKQAKKIAGNTIITQRATVRNAPRLPFPTAENTNEHAIWFCTPTTQGNYLLERILSGLTQRPTANELETDFRQRVAQHFPAAVIEHVEIRSYSHATPLLETGALRPKTWQGGGFYYAGDWAATNLPATLESAAMSGFEAGEKAALESA